VKISLEFACEAKIVSKAHAILCPMMSSAVSGTTFLGLNALTEFFFLRRKRLVRLFPSQNSQSHTVNEDLE